MFMEIIEIQECNIISRGNVKNHEDDSDEMKYGGGCNYIETLLTRSPTMKYSYSNKTQSISISLNKKGKPN